MRLIFTLLLFLPALTTVGQSDESHVEAALVLDHAEIAKGEPFYFGVHLKMYDDWHTYWEYGGFAGLPSTLTIEDIPGLTIEPLEFPWPKKYVDKEGFVTFGYGDEVVHTARAVYNGDATSLDLKGLITWLECKEICIPGKQKVSMTLPVGTSKPANQALFAKNRATTPINYSADSPFVLASDFTFTEEKWTGTVTLTLKDGAPFKADADAYTVYAHGADYFEPKETTVKVDGNTVTIDLSYDAFDVKPADLKLMAAMQVDGTDGKKHYYRMQMHPVGDAATTAAATTDASDEKTATAPLNAVPTYTIWFALLLALAGGLILNLMPCVLPVLSIKIFSLLNKAGETPGKRQTSAWFYTFGIMASFLALSLFFVAAKSAGEQLGVGFQFQNPYFVIGITALIFIMGLSFVGVFDFGTMSSGKLQTLSTKSGPSGAFFQGVLMTILSTPCTAPMLGAAYGWALAQPAFLIIATFQVIAFGLAFPFLALSYAPALLKFLPKPGPWMETFKVIMGFLLMGTVIWLFFVLGGLVGTAGVVGTMTLLLGMAAAATLYGKTWYTEQRVRGLVYAVGAVLLTGYLGMFKLYDIAEPFRMKQEKEEALILSYLSKNGGGEDVIAKIEAIKTTADKLRWVPYSKSNLEHFRSNDRMVFVDFTADWCMSCKANERGVLNTKKIRSLFADHDVVTMKADYTNYDEEITLILKSFDRAGVPMYLVYPGEGEPILLPEIITPGIVTNAVTEALATRNARHASRNQ